MALDRRNLLLTLSAAMSQPSVAGSAAVADLKGDVAILASALRLHPGLHRYNTPDEIDARVAALEPAFIGAVSRADRYLILSRFLAAIRCGHTYANFYNQSRGVSLELFERPTRLPFSFRWLGRRMVVTRDPNRLGLTPGTEVRAVNGRPAGAILDALLPFTRADGHNDGKRRSLLEVQGRDRIEFFDVFQGLVFAPPKDGVHRLDVTLAGGRNAVLEAPAITLTQRRDQMAETPIMDGPLWRWRLEPDGVAVLTMPTWAVYNSRWDWRTWLKERLDGLASARGLVIDLRANEGGEDCGHPILARLAQHGVEIRDAERRVRFQRTPAALDPYLDTWDDSFRTLGVGAEPVGEGTYRLSPNSGMSVIVPETPRFSGPAAVLVGPVCSSATFQFAQIGQSNGLLRLFGETTGGNRRGINGGSFFFVRLPASGLEFDLPLVGYFPPGSPPDAGLDPDVHVAPTIEDLASGRDPVLETALRWVRAA